MDSHRREVRGAILKAVGHVVASRGLLAVSMSEVAETAGIGRATLYKYFSDVQQLLAAWHADAVAAHLAELAALASGPGQPEARLRSVLQGYEQICRQRARHGGEGVGAALHHSPADQQPEDQLRNLVAGLIAEAAMAGTVRADVAPKLLAGFCVAALGAADHSEPAADDKTLVDLVWAGLVNQTTPVS